MQSHSLGACSHNELVARQTATDRNRRDSPTCCKRTASAVAWPCTTSNWSCGHKRRHASTTECIQALLASYLTTADDMSTAHGHMAVALQLRMLDFEAAPQQLHPPQSAPPQLA